MAIQQLSGMEIAQVSGGGNGLLSPILDPAVSEFFSLISSQPIQQAILNGYNTTLQVLQQTGVDSLIGKIVGVVIP